MKGKLKKTLFKQFDTVCDVSDHCFTKLNPSNRQGSYGTQYQINQEREVFPKGLPKSIFVRDYKGRTDLLRVLVIGDPGTPFQDGLFFFDLHFSPDSHAFLFPNVRLLSHDLPISFRTRIVAQSRYHLKLVFCKMLLIAAEDGFLESEIGTAYGEYPDENLYMLACETMLHALSRPPRHFEEFVLCYFHERAHMILKACEAYMKGHVKIGSFGEKGSSSSSENVVVSEKFKASMETIYPKLQEALQQFTEKKRKVRNIRNTINKVKRLFGLKKY